MCCLGTFNHAASAKMQSGRTCMFIGCKSRLYRTFCKLNRYYRAVRALLDKPDDAFINFQRVLRGHVDKTFLWFDNMRIRDNRAMIKTRVYSAVANFVKKKCRLLDKKISLYWRQQRIVNNKKWEKERERERRHCVTNLFRDALMLKIFILAKCDFNRFIIFCS